MVSVGALDAGDAPVCTDIICDKRYLLQEICKVRNLDAVETSRDKYRLMGHATTGPHTRRRTAG